MVRLQQVSIILLAVVLAGAMVLLGRWQLHVYQEQGARSSAARAAEPPVPLSTVAPVGAAITDGYGRSVSFEGTYDPTLQLLVPVADGPGRFRVLTALRQKDGSLVPVVRGVVDRSVVPDPPVDPVHQVGVLLPSEDAPEQTTPPGQLGSVRVPALAQVWSGPLVGGYVTLAAPDAETQGLTAATLALPDAPGRFRNAAYAVQWWLFAAFTVLMAVRIARDLGRTDPEAVPEITAGTTSDPT